MEDRYTLREILEKYVSEVQIEEVIKEAMEKEEKYEQNKKQKEKYKKELEERRKNGPIFITPRDERPLKVEKELTFDEQVWWAIQKNAKAHGMSEAAMVNLVLKTLFLK